MKFLRATVPAIIVLLVAVAISAVLKHTRPEPETASRQNKSPSVEAIVVTPGSYQVIISTRGEVRARTRSVLIPEVSGRIVSVSHAFREGGFFEEDEILAEIDPRDYQIAVTIATSNVTEAETAYAQEKARAAQAKENWRSLGQGPPANDLVLRLPQLAEAEARVAASKAQLEQAEVDLSRTKIRAPYIGRVLEQMVDVGQFVSTGTSLARIFAVDYAEVRLPLTNQQTAFIDLPEDFRGEKGITDEDAPQRPAVTLTKQQGVNKFSWEGKVVRTEGAIDTRSRQLFVVAQVDDPYARRDDGTPPLKIGDFVEARITGTLLDDVYNIPRTAIRGGDRVLVIDAEQRLRVRDVKVVWSDAEEVIISSGLNPDDLVCTTPPAYATEGAEVSPILPDGPADPIAPAPRSD